MLHCVILLEVDLGHIEFIHSDRVFLKESFVKNSYENFSLFYICNILNANLKTVRFVDTIFLASKKRCSPQLTMAVGPISVLVCEYFLTPNDCTSIIGLHVSLPKISISLLTLH